jgi:hypothetical protein
VGSYQANRVEAQMTKQQIRREIHALELSHRDAVGAYIKTRQARHQRQMVAISRKLATLRRLDGVS